MDDSTPKDLAETAVETGPRDRTPSPSDTANLESGLSPVGAVARAIAAAAGPEGLLVVAADERRAALLAAIVPAFAPGIEVLHLPRWDCLPDEPVPPAREITGRRVAVLTRLAEARAAVLVASPEALALRLPPRDVLERERRRLAVGDVLDLQALAAHLVRTGWTLDERVDEPGEAAVRGQVVDIFPAGRDAPIRIEHADGRVTAIHDFDPATQRTTGNLPFADLLPASEAIPPEADPDVGSERPRDAEHRIAAWYPSPETIFDYVGAAAVLLEPDTDERMRELTGPGREPGSYPGLLLSSDAWAAGLAARNAGRLAPAAARAPRFAAESDAADAAHRAVEGWLAGGRQVVIAAIADADRARIARMLRRDLEPAADLSEAMAAKGAALPVLSAPLERGFVADDLAIVTAADLLGSRARSRRGGARPLPAFADEAMDFRLGDTVVHRDHGLGVLAGLEVVEALGEQVEMLRLDYAGGTHQMVPVAEIGRVWRYGADADEVTLDKLDGRAWERRRAKVEAAVTETATALVATARERAGMEAPRIRPPAAAYERFAGRFAFPETDDQAAAIDAVLDDLAAGRPMDRLVCGDVGYGKTEVALRAVAAVALSGRQVAVIAPTTVLARQHLATITHRFAGLGVEVGALTRFVPAAEARRVKAGLADGTIRVVVGTHAVAGKGVRYKDLALVVIDEEQRFGAAQKAAFRRLAEGRHVLALTATPIPRTLQSALAGLQDLSLIETPPGPRRPIRTYAGRFDPAIIRDALRREQARGGQSFVVCPRIEDLEPMAERLAALVPELSVRTLHGRMAGDEMDRVLVAFGAGDGDILLATAIVESGLDMPRVNLMVVWHADRFGLAQLHQLRGRVGRGRRRGTVHLTTDPDGDVTPSATKRLETLASLDRLGAGFEISARDLDQRGAGDLLGDEQAGHVKLIGAGLYRHLVERAIRSARGERLDDDVAPEIRLGQPGRITPETVPEPEVRIGLYARLAAIADPDDADAFLEEFADRFGPPPEEVRGLAATARLVALARRAGVRRVDGGPRAVAFDFADEPAAARSAKALGPEVEHKETRLVRPGDFGDVAARIEAAEALLRRLA